jgi:outer membrane protein assembly factor BamB
VEPSKDLSKHTWIVYCLDKRTGKILWEKIAAEGIPEVKRHPKSTQANSTPATDGKYLAVLIATGDLLLYNMDGKLLWKKDLGVLNSGWFYDPDYEWAYGSSPVLYENLVIVQCDLQKNSFIAAFDVRNGNQVWRTPREEIPSWGSPTIHVSRQRAEVITNGSAYVRGYDALTGKELWKLAGNSEITVPTPFVAQDLIYVTSGYSPIQPIYAIKVGATGDISLKKDQESNDSVAWSKQRGGPYLPTPIVYGAYLYTCANNGVVTVYNALTGEKIYQQRLGGKGSAYAFTASPVASDGKLYFTSEDGEIFVVKAGPVFEVLATNKMNDVILATPAISEGMIIVRSVNNVYGIAKNERR